MRTTLLSLRNGIVIYQGHLADNGAAANGNCDLRFLLFDVPGGGVAIAGPITNSNLYQFLDPQGTNAPAAALSPALAVVHRFPGST